MSSTRRILVTGAGGFVGRWLTKELRARFGVEAQISALVRSNSSVAGVDQHFVADICDLSAVDKVVSEVSPTCVVHMAAISSVGASRSSPRHAWNVNLYGTMNLAEAVLKHVPNCQFIFVGSSEIYGGSSRNCASSKIDEKALLVPRNAYAASKAAADLLVGEMAESGLRAVRFRPFNHTGPGQNSNFAVPGFARQLARIEQGLQEPVVRVGNLDVLRDFCDVRDIVRGYAAAIEKPQLIEPGTIINLASGNARQIGSILSDLLALVDCPILVERDPARQRLADAPFVQGDARLARELLSWSPEIRWSKTLCDVLDDQRRQVEAGLG